MSEAEQSSRAVNVYPVWERDLPFVLGTLSEAIATKGAHFLSLAHNPAEERVMNSPGAWLTFSRLEYDDFREVVRLFTASLEERLPEVEVRIFLLENARSERLKKLRAESDATGEAES